MEILLLGHDGQIGWELEKRLGSLGDVHGLSHPDIEYTNMDTVVGVIRERKPDLIINAAAYTAVDQAESEVDTAMAVNGTAPGIIAEEASKAGALLVHYSTDYVFDGSKGTPYVEDDKANPINVYGRSKLAGDEAVMAAGGRSLIFRVSWIYGMRGSNFLLTLRKLAISRSEFSVVNDQTGCPTWCGSIAEGTVGVLKQVTAGKDAYGIYNMVCAGDTTWFGFAEEILGDTVTVTPITSAEYPTDAKRLAYSVLDCSLLKDTFGVELPEWRDAFRLCLTSG